MITAIQQKLDTLTDINKTIKTIGMYTWIGAGVFFLGYVYFVGAITFSVIKERELQQETKTLISSMSMQELSYLNLQKSFTKEYAVASGFITQSPVAFVAPQRALAWNVGR